MAGHTARSELDMFNSFANRAAPPQQGRSFDDAVAAHRRSGADTQEVRGGSEGSSGGLSEGSRGWPHQPLSCDPSSSTPTTTLQKSDVSSERFMTVAEEPAARRCVASRYLHTNNGHMDMDMEWAWAGAWAWTWHVHVHEHDMHMPHAHAHAHAHVCEASS